jgi:hydroxyacylglutathione hydrolase
MQIIDKILGPIETRTILAYCPKTFEAILVDPSFYSFHHFHPIIKEKNLDLKGIFLTHSHYDHIVDAAKFRDKNVAVYVHELDAKNLIAPGADGLRSLKGIEGVLDPILMHEHDTYNFGNIHFVVIHTPGHSPGSVCFYFPEQGILFSGDTLFRGGIGRLDLPTGQPELMGASLEKLKLLPKQTVVYPGHGPKTTIMEEL